MSVFDFYLMISIIFTMIVGILYVLFGQVTVRRLRKNPETKEALGFEYVSGRDIMNVAIALSIPGNLNRRARHSRMKFLYADADVLRQHTNRLDRVLARILAYSFFSTAFGLSTILVMHYFGVF